MNNPKSRNYKILVIGATGGVGVHLVNQLLKLGYDVIGSGHDQDDIGRAKEHLPAEAKLFVADFSDAEIGRAQVAEAIKANGGDLSVVVSCVGVNPCGPLETTPISVFRATMEINAVANLAIYQVTLPYLRQTRGRAILFSSLAGKVAMPLLGYYAASKYAVEGLADTMRLEAGQWGVAVSLIQPGAIATGMVHGFGKQLDARLGELDYEGAENYRDYFAQQKAFALASDTIAISPDEVAKSIIQVILSDSPKSRYALGAAVDFLEQRSQLSDEEMDAMMNQILPGSRG